MCEADYSIVCFAVVGAAEVFPPCKDDPTLFPSGTLTPGVLCPEPWVQSCISRIIEHYYGLPRNVAKRYGGI